MPPSTLPLALLLVGCGDFGLHGYASTTRAATEGDTGYSSGSGNGGGGGQNDDAEPVSGSIEGATWAVDLADVSFTEPPGMSAVLSFMDSTVLLFHATKEKAHDLDLVVALAAADGSQDPCERVQSLPTADWDNPNFAIDQGTLSLTISHENVDFRDAILSATVEPDGEGWDDGVLSGNIDARELSAALPEGTDVCDLVDGMGGSCQKCDDGEVQCFDMLIEDIEAEPAKGDFDASLSGC